MALSTTSADMLALVPLPDVGTMCEKFKNGLLVNQVFYDWFAEMYTEGGDFTEEFNVLLKAARTP